MYFLFYYNFKFLILFFLVRFYKLSRWQWIIWSFLLLLFSFVLYYTGLNIRYSHIVLLWLNTLNFNFFPDNTFNNILLECQFFTLRCMVFSRDFNLAFDNRFVYSDLLPKMGLTRQCICLNFVEVYQVLQLICSGGDPVEIQQRLQMLQNLPHLDGNAYTLQLSKILKNPEMFGFSMTLFGLFLANYFILYDLRHMPNFHSMSAQALKAVGEVLGTGFKEFVYQPYIIFGSIFVGFLRVLFIIVYYFSLR